MAANRRIPDNIRMQVADLHRAGKSNQKIAGMLGISPTTVQHILLKDAENTRYHQKSHDGIAKDYTEGMTKSAICAKYHVSGGLLRSVVLARCLPPRPPRKPKWQEYQRPIAEAYNQGKELSEICRTFRVSASSVYRALEASGDFSRRRYCCDMQARQEEILLLLGQKKTVAEICSQLGVTPYAVRLAGARETVAETGWYPGTSIAHKREPVNGTETQRTFKPETQASAGFPETVLFEFPGVAMPVQVRIGA